MNHQNNSLGIGQIPARFSLILILGIWSNWVIGSSISSSGGNIDTLLFLPEGTRLIIQLEEDIHTEYSFYGNSFDAILVEEVAHGAKVLIPEGTEVRGVIKASERARNIGPRAYLALELEELAVLDVWLPIHTDRLGFTGNPSNTDVKVGIGAGIGAFLGGFKGAVKGALVGLGVSALSAGKQIHLRQGTELEFYLDEAVLLVSEKL